MPTEGDLSGKGEKHEKDAPITRRLADLNSQVQALQKQVDNLAQKVNSAYYRDNQETSAAFARLQQGQDILADTLTVMTGALERALKRPQMIQQVDPQFQDRREGNEIFLQMRTTRWRTNEKSLKEAARLATLEREKTPLCPCGKHQGIRLVEEVVQGPWEEGQAETERVVVEENICPVEFWLTLSRLAYTDGLLAAFNREAPLAGFLSEYRLAEDKS